MKTTLKFGDANLNIKEAWFTINDQVEIMYLNGKGYIPFFCANTKTFIPHWHAHMKTFNISATALFMKHKKHMSTLQQRDFFNTLDEAVCVALSWSQQDLLRMAQESYMYNPTSHIKIGNSVMLKSQFKREFKKIVDEMLNPAA